MGQSCVSTSVKTEKWSVTCKKRSEYIYVNMYTHTQSFKNYWTYENKKVQKYQKVQNFRHFIPNNQNFNFWNSNKSPSFWPHPHRPLYTITVRQIYLISRVSYFPSFLYSLRFLILQRHSSILSFNFFCSHSSFNFFCSHLSVNLHSSATLSVLCKFLILILFLFEFSHFGFEFMFDLMACIWISACIVCFLSICLRFAVIFKVWNDFFVD